MHYVVTMANQQALQDKIARAFMDYGEAADIYLNGVKQHPLDGVTLQALDRIIIETPPEPNVVDMIGALEEQEVAQTVLEPRDPYIVVGCVDPRHRRVNDLLVPDPSCQTCLGLGIVRVMREHVPVVHRRGARWERGDDAVSRIADLSGPPV